MNGINTISDDLVKIENIIRIYLDLLYKGNVDLIKSVFHQEATVSSISEGKIISINMEGFRKRVATRESPESIGETRHDKIILIDISSPTTAIAKVECMILKNHYTDYLSFIKVSEKWGIISKVFHMSHGA
ncbi:MAG: nuclear transport factor 2 family protein [Dehalococcoidia bacterium]|nr:nuclear transport factor 2 family protein [Dehalococcoidia bacterium]